MPRRAPLPAVQQQPQLSPDDPVAQNIAKLRRTWKFAAICQFIFTFEEAFGLSGFKSETLEHDLAAASYVMVPDLMKRLIYTLTLDRRVSLENWQQYLRSQYQSRFEDEYNPGPNPLGTEENPKAWESLTLPGKVRTIHDLCEWQWSEPERFRKLLKSEEDPENWRVYPIGYDSKDNTYWLFDDNRLWVQHPPPPKPKAKAPPKKNSKKAKAEAAAARRKAAAEAAKQKQQQQQSKRSAPSAQDTPNKRARTGNASSATSTNGHTTGRGTRSSRRSGVGLQEDEELVNIPPELQDFNKPPRNASHSKSEPTADDESELSDPPEGTVDADDSTMDVDQNDASLVIKDEHEEEEQKPAEEDATDPDEETWVEYETIAVTKSEWEAASQLFAKSKHPDEKALHKQLRDDFAPRVLSDIAEAERQAAMEAALASRKRSSRIALKESEKEEKEREVQARLQMEERMKAIRQEEEDRRRKEDEAQKEERRREDRLREREERIKAREQEAQEKMYREIRDKERKEKMREMRQRKREMIASGEIHPDDVEDGITKQGTGADDGSAGDDEDWDLRCEICHKAGRNPELAPGEEIVCCESCMVWQHTKCWDGFDAWTKRPLRKWDDEDFFCTDCKAKRSAATNKVDSVQSVPPSGSAESSAAQPPIGVDSPANASSSNFDKSAVRSQIEAYRRASGMPLSEEEKQRQRTKKIVLKRSASGTPGQSGSTPAGSPPQSGQQGKASPLARSGPSSMPHAQSPSSFAPYQSPIPPAGQPSHPYSSRPIVPTTANGGTPNKPLLGPNFPHPSGPSQPLHQPYPQHYQQPYQQQYHPHGPQQPYPSMAGPMSNGSMPPAGAYPYMHPPGLPQHSARPQYSPNAPHSPYMMPPGSPHGGSQPPRPANASMGAPPVPAQHGSPYSSSPSHVTAHAYARSPPQSPGQGSSATRPLPQTTTPAAPANGASHSPSASANGARAQSPQKPVTAPGTAQVSGRPTSSSGSSSSTNKGATGSFPIRRPNSSVARSPLSGPSISPGGAQSYSTTATGVPHMSLGEAVSGQMRMARNQSPTPGARQGATSLSVPSQPMQSNGSSSPLTQSHSGPVQQPQQQQQQQQQSGPSPLAAPATSASAPVARHIEQAQVQSPSPTTGNGVHPLSSTNAGGPPPPTAAAQSAQAQAQAQPQPQPQQPAQPQVNQGPTSTS